MIKVNKLSLETIQKYLIYLSIALLPTQFAKVYFPNFLLWGYRIDYFAIWIYLLDIIFILIIFLQLLKSRLDNMCPVLPLRLTFLWNLFQLIFIKLKLSHFLFSVKIILIHLWSRTVSDLKIKRSVINKIFICQLFSLLVIALGQFIRQASIGGPLYFLGERSFNYYTPGIAKEFIVGQSLLRPYATFSHPNTLAGYSLVIMFYVLLSNKQTKNLVKTIALILGIAIILLSFSMSAYFVAVVGFWGVFIKKRVTLIKYKKLIVSLVLLFCLLMPILLLVIGEGSDSLEIRNNIFGNIKQIPTLNLLLGTGWLQAMLFRTNSQSFQLLQPIHNSLYEIILSIGLIPSLILLKKFFLTFIKSLNQSQIFLLCLILLLSSFDHCFLSSHQGLTLMIFVLSTKQ